MYRDARKKARSHDPRKTIRGKLAMQFFCRFFENLSGIVGKTIKENGKDLRSRTQLGKNNFVTLSLEFVHDISEVEEFFARAVGRREANGASGSSA